MKNFLFVVVFLLFSSQLSAQPDNWYFSISMGGCWPAGSFSGMDAASSSSGFAHRGFALNLDATYPLGTNWGLKGMVVLNNNPIDRNGLGSLMESRMKKQIAFTEAQREFLTLTTDPWMSNSIVFGPVYSINFDRLSWDFQLMTGMNVAYLPNQKLLFSNPAQNWEYLQHNTNQINISMDFLAGTALRMKVTEKVQLKVALNLQYSRSKSSYEEVKTTTISNYSTIEQLNSGSTLVPKEIVTGTVGFVYYL